MGGLFLHLPEFISQVDESTAALSYDELKAAVRALAQEWDECGRNTFLRVLTSYKGKNSSAAELLAHSRLKMNEKITASLQRLQEIQAGKRFLDSEYSEEWSYWDSDPADEFVFSDPGCLLCEIQDAVELVHKAVDLDMLREGFSLVKAIATLTVNVSGDFEECDGEPISFYQLYEYNLLQIDFHDFAETAFYLAYMVHEPEERPSRIWEMVTLLGDFRFHLAKLLEMNNGELPDFDAFLPRWIGFLSEQEEMRWKAEKFIKDAASLLTDDQVFLENAKRYAHSFPFLYEFFLEKKLESLHSADCGQLLQAGLEALELVSGHGASRCRIALLTAKIADKMGDLDRRDECWLEAFRSAPSVLHYLRLKFLSNSWAKYQATVLKILEQRFCTDSSKQDPSLSNLAELTDANVSMEAYCTIMCFESRFDRMRAVGMDTDQALGWSVTFMKQGIAFILILLYLGDRPKSGIRSVLLSLMQTCSFSLDEYGQNTDTHNNQNDIDVFTDLIGKWKKDVQLDEGFADLWLKDIEHWIRIRTSAVLEKQLRNHYSHCAALIAAYGEVLESRGQADAKAIMMQRFHSLYPKYTAFRRALRDYSK